MEDCSGLLRLPIVLPSLVLICSDIARKVANDLVVTDGVDEALQFPPYDSASSDHMMF